MEKKERVVPIAGNDVIAQRNRDAVERFRREIFKNERNRVFRNPELALKELYEHAKSNLATLKCKVDNAKLFYEKAVKRKESGELNEDTFYAESVGARLLICFYESLQTLLERAHEAKDIYAVRRVGVVAHMLIASADSFLTEYRYLNDPTLRKKEVEQIIKMARGLYDDAIIALDGVHVELGVRLAEFPSSPLN